ncbi:MAG: hypothetical protein ACQES9_00620 [Myxococcota bacterium]
MPQKIKAQLHAALKKEKALQRRKRLIVLALALGIMVSILGSLTALQIIIPGTRGLLVTPLVSPFILLFTAVIIAFYLKKQLEYPVFILDKKCLVSWSGMFVSLVKKPIRFENFDKVKFLKTGCGLECAIYSADEVIIIPLVYKQTPEFLQWLLKLLKNKPANFEAEIKIIEQLASSWVAEKELKSRNDAEKLSFFLNFNFPIQYKNCLFKDKQKKINLHFDQFMDLYISERSHLDLLQLYSFATDFEKHGIKSRLVLLDILRLAMYLKLDAVVKSTFEKLENFDKVDKSEKGSVPNYLLEKWKKLYLSRKKFPIPYAGVTSRLFSGLGNQIEMDEEGKIKGQYLRTSLDVYVLILPIKGFFFFKEIQLMDIFGRRTIINRDTRNLLRKILGRAPHLLSVKLASFWPENRRINSKKIKLLN